MRLVNQAILFVALLLFVAVVSSDACTPTDTDTPTQTWTPEPTFTPTPTGTLATDTPTPTFPDDECKGPVLGHAGAIQPGLRGFPNADLRISCASLRWPVSKSCAFLRAPFARLIFVSVVEPHGRTFPEMLAMHIFAANSGYCTPGAVSRMERRWGLRPDWSPSSWDG